MDIMTLLKKRVTTKMMEVHYYSTSSLDQAACDASNTRATGCVCLHQVHTYQKAGEWQ